MREAKKEDSMELSLNQTADNTAKPKATSFFPLWKLKGTQPAVKIPAVCLAHLEEEIAEKDEGVDSEDPDSIEGVHGGIHGVPGEGCERCPKEREMLLSLWQLGPLYL